MDDAPIVVVGASVAGLNAIEAMRAVGYRGEIVVLEREQHAYYDRPPLSKGYLVEEAAASPCLRPLHFVRQELNCDVRLGQAALALDATTHRVATGSGWVRYSKLVIACGLDHRPLPVGGRSPQLHPLRSLADARRLRAALQARPSRLAVVGAGLIGSELTAAARQLGIETVLLGRSQDSLARCLGPDIAALVLHHHEECGVKVRLGVTPIDADPASLTLSDGTVEIVDMVAYGLGGIPATGWLQGSSVQLDDDGGIVCDERLSAASDVYAAGDSVSWPSRLFGRRVRREHWTTAAEQGSCAGANAASDTLSPFDTVPYMWADLYGARIQVVGVLEDASEHMVVQQRSEGRHLTIHSRDNCLVAAAGIGVPRTITKLRRHIRERGSWHDAVDIARSLS